MTTRQYPAKALPLLFACCMLTFAVDGRAQPEQFALDDAVEIAVANSPSLAAMSARLQALGTVPSQVNALPDPMLSVNAMSLPIDTFDTDQEPMTQLQIAYSQPLPFPGKRGIRKDIADLAVDEQLQRLEEAESQLISQVRSTWWQLLATEKTLEIFESNRLLLTDFIEIARAKYSVGRGLQQDVLLAELELNRVANQIVATNGNREAMAASLAGLLNLPAGRALAAQHDAVSTNLPDLASTVELANRGAQARNLLKAYRFRVHAAEKRFALAEKERFPDFRLGVGYGIRDGEHPSGKDRPDFLSVMFSMNLPIYAHNKQDRQIEQRAAEREEQQFMLDEALRSMAAEVGRMRAEYEAARQQAALLKDAIIPQAEQTVEAMMAGYQVNKVEFINVVNGQTMLYNAQISYWQSIARAMSAQAKIAALIGGEPFHE